MQRATKGVPKPVVVIDVAVDSNIDRATNVDEEEISRRSNKLNLLRMF